MNPDGGSPPSDGPRGEPTAEVVSPSCILPGDATGAGAANDPGASLEPERRAWLKDAGLLARGGMGRIQRIQDGRLRREVVAKVLGSNRPDSRRRFVEEAQITGQLEHPNIPPVHDLWLDETGSLCFTMKLVRGRTLTQLLAEKSPAERTDRELEELLQILLKVCDAVSYAHSRGVIHRDLKPDNVMVGTHGQVYVMDWGCALVRARPAAGDGQVVTVDRDPKAQPIDQPGDVVGTGSYMAPEQAKALNDFIDERTDVYLLGAVLYEILTRQPPHQGKDALASIKLAQANAVRDPAQVAAPAALPPGLCRIAMRALCASPADRYPTVDEFRRDLERSLRNGVWFASAQFPAGALVVREGDAADAAYIITAGTCEAFRQVDGQRVVLRRMGPGDTFGETAIFTARPRSASVVALEPLTVSVVTQGALARALAGDLWLVRFVRALAERFREADDQLNRSGAGSRPSRPGTSGS